MLFPRLVFKRMAPGWYWHVSQRRWSHSVEMCLLLYVPRASHVHFPEKRRKQQKCIVAPPLDPGLKYRGGFRRNCYRFGSESLLPLQMHPPVLLLLCGDALHADNLDLVDVPTDTGLLTLYLQLQSPPPPPQTAGFWCGFYEAVVLVLWRWSEKMDMKSSWMSCHFLPDWMFVWRSNDTDCSQRLPKADVWSVDMDVWT